MESGQGDPETSSTSWLPVVPSQFSNFVTGANPVLGIVYVQPLSSFHDVLSSVLVTSSLVFSVVPFMSHTTVDATSSSGGRSIGASEDVTVVSLTSCAHPPSPRTSPPRSGGGTRPGSARRMAACAFGPRPAQDRACQLNYFLNGSNVSQMETGQHPAAHTRKSANVSTQCWRLRSASALSVSSFSECAT